MSEPRTEAGRDRLAAALLVLAATRPMTETGAWETERILAADPTIEHDMEVGELLRAVEAALPEGKRLVIGVMDGYGGDSVTDRLRALLDRLLAPQERPE